ncbi:MAG TPA: DMT family transporter [Gemmatimonadaceae bacterium]|nr:DMT family transporter [Gemmatimonadaceae bacterium]
MPVRPAFVSAVLFLSVLGVSLSGPLVRLSSAHPIAIAVWRLAFSLVLVAVPLALRGSWRQWRTLDARALGFASAAGALLAIHFWSWNTSIGLTTIAASVVLVNVQPLIVAALSALWLRERPTRQQWAGIGIAMVGAIVVVLPDLLWSGRMTVNARALLGDALALVGAITAASYYVIGRRLRQTLDLWAYVALVYGACLASLLLMALALDVPLGPYPSREYGIFALLALGPMMLGHTGMNWALRHARAYQVNIVLLGEPIGATFLAALLPGIRERPTLFTLVGGVIVLAGILLAERRRGSD